MRFYQSLKLMTILVIITLLGACSHVASPAASDQEIEVKQNEDSKKTEMILATTTSTQDSGLLDELIPIFEQEHNIIVKTIAVGSGQALAMGENGEADALLTHAPKAEEELVAKEAVKNRKRVMYNDFVLVGPSSDPAGIQGESIETALQKIAAASIPFISRGDDSGTHKMELALWKKATVEPQSEGWYSETGQGMGSTLQVGSEKEGYVLTDRATFLAQEKNLTNMVVQVEGDDSLLNIYHVMQVNDAKHALVNEEAASLFVEFMVSEKVQLIIKEFGKEAYGQPLFFPYTEK